MQQLLAQDARHYSTFRLAATLAKVTVLSSLAELQHYQPQQLPLLLGEGSNSIFLSDWPGEILRYVAAGRQLEVSGDQLHLHVEAGHNWHQLVSWSVGQGWWGLENLALIPGSVGAAPVQNIGAYGAELADTCSYVDFFHWQSRQVQRLTAAECRFGYRDSIFKQQLAGKGVIVAVGFCLKRNGSPKLNYNGLDHLTAQASLLDVMNAVIAVRRKKLPDPAILPNCGSFFKNPVIPAALFQQLYQQYPAMPHYPQPQQQVKLAAAWLIEQVGLKGYQLGGVACYQQQPLVLVNQNNGTAAELLQLITLIQQAVFARFGVQLEPEVRLLRHHD
ncbi:UDP-N-acetylmuramate dehydrogenase [Rheinheimera sp. 4Y26]|uniref:UDP-N-acetylmuramate dehydrogenase n=1 Tax=Rheinheimera sp. 4Y26 TaxID=2977811 RepID=UPI0021B1309B|nr:UDP-N-acetylmuramate dehydrogenase [Rheinheimera sp. 4Y26]MCT6701459.1 UDP-N-acetylmuramate dehydrogenase [Rheinheimera sp. 4Y26]